MCDPVSAIMAAAAIGGAAMQGVSGMAAARANAAALRRQGDAEYGAALAESNNLRYQGDRLAGEIAAEQGASGVALDSGSAAEVAAESRKNVELDAMRVMYGGVLRRQGLYHQARIENKQARAQAYSSILGAALGSAASLYGGAGSGGASRPVAATAANRPPRQALPTVY